MEIGSFKIYTLGCKVNRCDSKALAEELFCFGAKEVLENADLAIINTCSVTKSAISKNKRLINKARKENPKAQIVLTGCWSEVYEIKAREIGVDFIVRKEDFSDFLDSQGFEKNNHPGFAIPERAGRYFIKIQDGCEQFCSYCVIPFARGKLWSRPEAEILAEAEFASKNNFTEIVLTGIHLGLYGQENNKNKSLVDLLKKIIKIKNIKRIRLSSIELNEVSDDLIDLIKKEKKLCRHLHIPLQSGSDKILKLMRRPYDTKKFKQKIAEIRKKIPNIAVSTDVMTGFPGEGEEEFDRICKFLTEIKFSRIHVFPFSAHDRAPASKFPDQIDIKTKKKRAEILRKISTESEKEFRNKFRGKKLEIIVESVFGGKVKGRTEYYFEVEVEGPAEKGESVLVAIV